MVRTRLEGHEQRRTGRVDSAGAGVLDRLDLRVSTAELGVESLADDLIVSNQHGPDHGVGTHPSVPARRKLQRAAKMKPILVCGHG
jgi:hypothetical protein